jgi:hypothetical protein
MLDVDDKRFSKSLPDAAVIGEAQEGVWQPDGRGRAEADLEAFGVPVHLRSHVSRDAVRLALSVLN